MEAAPSTWKAHLPCDVGQVGSGRWLPAAPGWPSRPSAVEPPVGIASTHKAARSASVFARTRGLTPSSGTTSTATCRSASRPPLDPAQQEHPGALGQVHEQVEVGGRTLLTTRDAAEHPHIAEAVLRGQSEHGRPPPAQAVPADGRSRESRSTITPGARSPVVSDRGRSDPWGSGGTGVSPSSSSSRRPYWSGRLPQPQYAAGRSGTSPSASYGSMRWSPTVHR